MLSDDPESEHSYTGKLFELLRLGKPILAVGPKNSIIKGVLDQTQGGKYAHVSDIDQIVSCINKLLSLPQNRPIPLQILHQYSREHLTKSLLDLYN
ncbi:MAG: hypothetical protein PHO32_02135, partial [Candidatus Cloacimonetes bacterium]|nr:hypothetical protein [Candidatus Cloacimonadota bacterium]